LSDNARLIGAGQTFDVACAGIADRDPVALRIHDVTALSHRNERCQKAVECREARLVLAKRIIPADRLFRGA
jgi:hypothetical protein